MLIQVGCGESKKNGRCDEDERILRGKNVKNVRMGLMSELGFKTEVSRF